MCLVWACLQAATNAFVSAVESDRACSEDESVLVTWVWFW
jgi:hypothetical protein